MNRLSQKLAATVSVRGLVERVEAEGEAESRTCLNISEIV